MRIRTFYAETRELEDREVFEENLLRLPPWKIGKIRGMAQPGRRLESLCAWLLFLRGVEKLGIPVPEVIQGEHGRPCVGGRRDMDFSLSHSGSLAVCSIALSDGEEPLRVGVDIERRRERDFSAVARRFFTPAECEAVAARRDGEDRKNLFYRYWTLKESCLKAEGSGLSGGLDALSLVLPEEPGRVRGRAFGRDWFFHEYCVEGVFPDNVSGEGREETYALSVCCSLDGCAETPERVSFL